MRFGILGNLRVEGVRPHALRGPRLRGLLAMLLLETGQVVPAERLIDGLYGADPPRTAGNALQSQVSRLRQALPGSATPLVEHHPGGYRLAVSPDAVDAHRFARLAAAGRSALRDGDPRHAATQLREALDLWRGPALADLAALPFAASQATRLEEMRLSATEDHARAVLDSGLDDDLLPGLRRAATTHPLRESTRALLIRALHGGGRQAEALAEFEEIRRRLAEELGADPSPELAEAHIAVLRGESPPPPEPVRHRGIPHQITSFVGRDEEIRRAEKHLESRRLVTLVGPGGAGKTRISIELATRQAIDVTFVDLAGLTNAADLPQALYSALGLRAVGLARPTGPDNTTGVMERITTALTARPTLLILDNCEHLVDHVAALTTRLLSAVAELRVLATSREPLGVTGEALIRLSGLPQGDPTDGEPARLAAVRLFADRAADAVPDFALTPGTTPTVVQICRALDGLPLGIELAAARLRTLPLREIATRLDDRFRLLSRGSRTALPRHQTLRAVVEWSWDLLTAPERRLARRLTVFTGGCDLAAVVAMCGAPRSETQDLLDGLTEKSLIEASDGRYRMLDTIRVFCAERLTEAGEDDAVRRAHATHFLELAETADRHLRGREQLAWLRVLDTERDNLNAAVRRSIAHDDPHTALRLLSGLSFYWWMRGARREATAFAGEVMALLPDGAPEGLSEEYLLCSLLDALGGADRSRMARLREETVERYMALVEGAVPVRQPFLMYVSAVAMGPEVLGDASVAREWHRYRPVFCQYPRFDAVWSVGTAFLALIDGDPARAHDAFGAALDKFRALGDRWGLMLALNGRTDSANGLGDTTTALAAVEEALTLADELGSLIDTADLVRMRGMILLRTGDTAGARAELHRSVDLARRAGAPEHSAAAQVALASIALDHGEVDSARHLAEQARQECPVGWYLAEDIHGEIDHLMTRISHAERHDDQVNGPA